MQSKIRRKGVALPKSRIRREPLLRVPERRLSEAELRKAEAKARELEMWGGLGGMLLFGAGVAALAIVIGVATSFRFGADDPASAARFEQCYSSDGGSCVSDGDTIYVAGEKVEIAGIEAPLIQGAKCEAERSRGIDATMRLAALLNSGNVTVSRAFRDLSGRTVRHVLVNGEDAGGAMTSAGLARRIGSSEPNWCAAVDDSSDTGA
jgi:endonuclease YncB( thermonuclease family)